MRKDIAGPFRTPTVLAALALVALGAALAAAACGLGAPSAPIEVAAGIDHSEWSRLLRAYVDERGLVDYARWKASESDRAALKSYLSRFAAAPATPAQKADKGAALVNAYNAFTVSWILEHYPVESIQELPASFTAARHRIGARDVSLDDIENGTLRPQVGFLVHAALVCAARSCPPLAREAYRADRLVSQTSYAMLRWLARDDLNHFDLAERRAEISPIFRWNAADFEKEKGGVRGVLSIYAPDAYRSFVTGESCRIGYKPYDWGLNDQGAHGRQYRRSLWYRIKEKLGA
ncbi:MAG: DUF547 domain-containing protein [Acidobacteria bacterium]|nr:DUF547 domain-containing protein [Acidobacteriota bacterium]